MMFAIGAGDQLVAVSSWSDYPREVLELPEVGSSFEQGDEFGTVESVKAVSELFMPVAGEIIEINEELLQNLQITGGEKMRHPHPKPEARKLDRCSQLGLVSTEEAMKDSGFSLEDYDNVANAYIEGAERASDPASLASVASFFVSRVDSYTDQALERVGTEEALARRGTIAVAASAAPCWPMPSAGRAPAA